MKNKTRILSPLLFNIILVEGLSNIVFANHMIMYRKCHGTCTKKLLEVVSWNSTRSWNSNEYSKIIFLYISSKQLKSEISKVQFTVAPKNIRGLRIKFSNCM